MTKPNPTPAQIAAQVTRHDVEKSGVGNAQLGHQWKWFQRNADRTGVLEGGRGAQRVAIPREKLEESHCQVPMPGECPNLAMARPSRDHPKFW
jgi:hypothetical protein